jgi:hypothetical protein
MAEDTQKKSLEERETEIVPEEEIPEEIRKNLPPGATVRRVKKRKVKQSDTIQSLQQQAKERKDLVLIKQERQGIPIEEGILPEKGDEVELRPTTLRGKWENFWYHHKRAVIVWAFIVVLVVIGLVGWLYPKQYDVNIILATQYPLDDPDIDIQEPFAKYTEDFDGNGKLAVQVNVMEIVRDEELESSNHYANIINQLKLVFAMEDYSPALYILDDANYRYMTEEVDIQFRDLSDLDPTGKITGDRVALSDTPLADDFPQFTQLFQELYICIYDTEQMKTNADGEPEDKFLGDEEYVQMYENSLTYLTHLLNNETFEISK